MKDFSSLINKAVYVHVTEAGKQDPVSIYRLIRKDRPMDDRRVQRLTNIDPDVAFFATTRLLSPVEPRVFMQRDLQNGKWTKQGLRLPKMTLRFLGEQYVTIHDSRGQLLPSTPKTSLR